MDGGGEMKTSETRSTNTGSVLSPTPRCEARAAALRYVAETVLSERREEEEEEDLCSSILSSFISNLEDRQWDSIRERMRQPVSDLLPVHLSPSQKTVCFSAQSFGHAWPLRPRLVYRFCGIWLLFNRREFKPKCPNVETFCFSLNLFSSLK